MSVQTIVTRNRTPLVLALLVVLPASAWAQHADHAPSQSAQSRPSAAHPHPSDHAGSPAQAPAGRPQAHTRDDIAHAHDGHGVEGHAHSDPVAHDTHAGHGTHDGHADHRAHGTHEGHGAAHGQHGQHHGSDRHDGHAGHAHAHPPTHTERSEHEGHAAHTDHDHHDHRERTSDRPRTPIPALTEADFAAAFPQLGHHAMEHASPVTTMVLFDRLEAWDADHGTGQAWEATAWVGGDIHRLWLRSEGERSGGRTESSDLEVLYGRSVSAWWDVVGGVRQDFRPGGRTWGAFGLQGLAPYMFEVSATAYVGGGGQVQLKAEAEYDIRFTNRLILQPLVEATVSSKNEPRQGIGSGLGKIETGLRLRYAFSRRFAPYVGVVHERSFGRTADYAEAAGGHARDTRVVAGVRVWF